MVGAFRTADEIERQLNDWLQGYVNTNINSTSESRARFPLLEGNVQVRERLGKAGSVRLHDSLCGRTISSTISRPPSTLSPNSRRPASDDAAAQEDRCHLRPMERRPAKPAVCSAKAILADALTAANAAVRKTPTDIGARVLLAELLAFSGNIDRADVVLDACADLDPTAAIVVAEFRQLLRGETARRQLFSDGRVPEFLGEPTAAQRLSLAAIVALRNGDSPEAGKLAAEAEEARVHPTGTAGDTAFDDMRDADDLLASCFEVITTTGKYFWIPPERVLLHGVSQCQAAARSLLASGDHAGCRWSRWRGLSAGHLPADGEHGSGNDGRVASGPRHRLAPGRRRRTDAAASAP